MENVFSLCNLPFVIHIHLCTYLTNCIKLCLMNAPLLAWRFKHGWLHEAPRVK